MRSPLRLASVAVMLLALLTACSSAPSKAPDVKTNVAIGPQKQAKTAPNKTKPAPYPVAKKNEPAKEEGLLHTQPATGGDNAICVGSWCSCATE